MLKNIEKRKEWKRKTKTRQTNINKEQRGKIQTIPPDIIESVTLRDGKKKSQLHEWKKIVESYAHNGQMQKPNHALQKLYIQRSKSTEICQSYL